MSKNIKIPSQVELAIKTLKKSGYDAYIVGGCVRDMLRQVKPKDWDITTNAKPEEIEKTFAKAGYKTFYENQFGTVTVLMQKPKSKSQNDKPKCKKSKTQKPETMPIEITPYRIDEQYSDKRHPDKIKWAKTIEQDLARRDFTVNAIALATGKKKHPKGVEGAKLLPRKEFRSFQIIDPFDGQEDLKNKTIRAVGEPDKRFTEDALRLIRAVRFACTLEEHGLWQIEEKTQKAIRENAQLLEQISKERIRDELLKMIMHPQAAKGIELLRRLGLLRYIMPELEQGFGVEQNKHHIYQVYQHNLLGLNYACQNNFSKYVRLAALLHDIAKPQTKQGKGENATFHNHEVVGAKMTRNILRRLRFSSKDVQKITKLVRWHLFYYNVGEVTASSVRRLLRKVGQEDIEELLQVRYADRIGSAVPKAEPYKLRHLKYLLEKVSADPISPKMLKINGDDIMRILNVPPSPKVGQILSVLLSEVMSDPNRNVLPHLEARVKELSKMSDLELEKSAQKAKTELEKIATKRDEMTKNKYWVT